MSSNVKRIPGEEGIWALIFGDLVIFTVFFLTYVYYRGENTALYVSQQALLSFDLGLINTLLLLTSSLFMAQAVSAAHKGAVQYIPFLLAAVIACGFGFVAVKVIEWGGKISAGIILNSNEFYTFYYMYTGIHLVHVLIGLVVLIWLLRSVRQKPIEKVANNLEQGGIFWHMVDLLWVVLFALLYLMK